MSLTLSALSVLLQTDLLHYSEERVESLQVKESSKKKESPRSSQAVTNHMREKRMKEKS